MVNQNIIAIVYDFDGTLSPLPMQEYTILPALGIKAEEFWKRVNEVVCEEGAENMLVYMRLLMERMNENKSTRFTRDSLVNMGKDIEYFSAVETWFKRINRYVADNTKGIELEHYIISAGLKEILEGCSIYDFFHQVYASEYSYDKNDGKPNYPKMLITDTNKTQFLFRINKGILKLNENINSHMPNHERRIPFSNMIYIGDGMTDVPSMAVIKQNGGHALSVYNSKETKGLEVCCKLLKANRIDFFSEADYSEGSQLEGLIKVILNYLIQKIDYHNKYFNR